MATKNTAWINAWRVSFCLVGLALAATAAILHDVLEPSPLTLGYLGIKLLDALGLALFIMGLLTLVLDLGHWKKYFEDRLSDVVIRQEYLRELNEAALLQHQLKIFKLYYHDEEIRDTGFVSYCLNKIHGFVVTPFRSNVHDYITIEKDAPDGLLIQNDLRYVLRKARGRIQARVGWQANSMEVLQMHDLVLELWWPDGSQNAGEILDRVDMKRFAETVDPDGSVTYQYSLEPYKDLDGLIVKIKATYTVASSAFYTWRMIDPSEKVELNIKYPPEFNIQFKPFLLERVPAHRIDDPGFFHIAFDSWIMPRSGFAWKLLPADVPMRVRTPDARIAETPQVLQPASSEFLLNRNSETAAPAG